jgi:hypothetical protein
MVSSKVEQCVREGIFGRNCRRRVRRLGRCCDKFGFDIQGALARVQSTFSATPVAQIAEKWLNSAANRRLTLIFSVSRYLTKRAGPPRQPIRRAV